MHTFLIKSRKEESFLNIYDVSESAPRPIQFISRNIHEEMFYHIAHFLYVLLLPLTNVLGHNDQLRKDS